jgi:hypothetical protein
MQIKWDSLALVAGVSAVAGLAVMTLVALAVVGLSARAGAPSVVRVDAVRTDRAGGWGGRLSPAAGTALTVASLAAVVAIVGYGLFVIVS